MESASGTNAVPLLDAAGSTIAMVDNASGAITSQYSYDPMGGATVSGGGYQTVYQYHGMENDGWVYYGGHRYYSPTMGRFLSLSGPLSSSGGYNSGLSGVVSAAMPGASGSGASAPGAGLDAFADAAGAFAAGADALAGLDSVLGVIAANVAPYAEPVAAAVELRRRGSSGSYFIDVAGFALGPLAEGCDATGATSGPGAPVTCFGIGLLVEGPPLGILGYKMESQCILEYQQQVQSCGE